MKSRNYIWIVALSGWFLAGCAATDPDNFEKRVEKWVPIGTTATKAQHIMEHHGFECSLVKPGMPFNAHGPEYLDCTRPQVWFHDWDARFIIEDGKVSAYGPITVDE